jgi:3-oxoacyl-[acyl-carrier protein] reductase
MVTQGSGVILTLSTPGSRMTGFGFPGYGVTCAAVEAFSRILAGELGPSGVRVVCLRLHAIPEALAVSHVREVFAGFAERADTTVEALLAEWARSGPLLGRFRRWPRSPKQPRSRLRIAPARRPGRSST